MFNQEGGFHFLILFFSRSATSPGCGTSSIMNCLRLPYPSTVSYTHLDVYKRQALDHVQIGGRAAGAGRLVGIQLPNLVVQLARTS